jgi:diguanylate cyclase (GGDEF)-like protein/PAS domain S-box-containing protein
MCYYDGKRQEPHPMSIYGHPFLLPAQAAAACLTLLAAAPAVPAAQRTADVMAGTWTYGGRPFMLLLGILVVVSAGMAVTGMVRARNAARRAAQMEKLLRQRLGETTEWADREREIRTLMHHAAIGIYRSTLDGSRFTEANKHLALLYGMHDEKEFLRTVTPLDMHPSGQNRQELMQKLRRDGVVSRQKILLRDKSGSLRHAITSALISSRNESIFGLIYDMTDEHNSKEEMRRTGAMLQSVIDAMPNPFFFKNARGRYKIVNRAFCRLVNRPAEALVDRTVEAFASPAMAQIYNDADAVLLTAAGPAVQRYETVVESEEGGTEVLLYKESICDDNGTITGIVGAAFDITSRKETESALRQAEERYRTIFMHALDGIFTCTPQGLLLEANPAFARMFGYESRETLLETAPSVRSLWVSSQTHDEVMGLLCNRQQLTAQRAEMLRRNGEHFWAEINCQAFYDMQGEVTRVEGVISDVTHHMMQERELRTQASTDKLTGLMNRYGFDEAFERLLAQAQRSSRKVGVAFIDLDGFKEINDRFGHDTGDMLLKEVARRLQQRVRETDITARPGGDEFAVLLWDVGGTEDLRRLGESLLDALRPPYRCDANVCTLTASIGLSLYPDHGLTAGTLLRQADQAMYAVKNAGKNAVRLAV